MVAIAGTFENGKIILEKEYTTKDKKVKVIVTFLETEVEKDEERRLTLDDFSFAKSQKLTEHIKSSFSDDVIEERRSAL